MLPSILNSEKNEEKSSHIYFYSAYTVQNLYIVLYTVTNVTKQFHRRIMMSFLCVSVSFYSTNMEILRIY